MPEEFTFVRVELVQVRERLRPLDEKIVAEIADSIKMVGVLQPIRVTRALVLVSGYHRLEACKRANKPECPAVFFDGTPDEATLAECDENLMRSELTVFQRNKHIALRVELCERTRHKPLGTSPIPTCGNALSKIPLGTEPAIEESAVQKTARELHLPDKTVYRAVETTRDVSAELQELIEGTDIENSQRELLALASVQEWKRIEVVKQALAEGRTVQSIVSEGKSGKPGAIERPEPLPKGHVGSRPFAAGASETGAPAPQGRPAYRPFASGGDADGEGEARQVPVGYRPFGTEPEEPLQAAQEATAEPVTPKAKAAAIRITDSDRVLKARPALAAATSCGCLCPECRDRMKRALA